MRLSEMKKRRQGRCEAHVVRLVALAALVICAILIASPSVSWAQETGDETPETIVGEDRESVWQDPADVDNDEEGTPDDEPGVQAEGDETQGQELGVEDTFTRSWADIAKKFGQAATSAAPVSINIGNLVPRYTGDPELVLEGGEVVLNLDGFTLDPRVNGRTSGSGHVITVRGGKLTIKGKTSWSVEGITGGDAGVGGGILVEGGQVVLQGCRIGGNEAERGGGIAVLAGSLTIGDALIEKNTATYGGGIYVAPEATFTMSGGVVSGNVADYGAGICLEGTSDVETIIAGGQVRSNKATCDGGGILVSGGVVRLGADVVVESNEAAEHGGNVCVGTDWATSESVLGLDRGVIRKGSAASGGGIALIDGRFVVFDGSIKENRASTGAGIAVLSGECRILGGHISDNVASYKGAGVAVVDGYLSLWGGYIEDNRAEPIDDEWGETTTAEGGGVLVGENGRLELRQDPTIRGNTRGDSPQDVFLEGDTIIEVNRDCLARTSVGVDVAELPELNETRPIATVGSYGEDFFVCQTPDCEVVHKEEGAGRGQALLLRVREREGTCVTSWADLSQRLRALKSGDRESFWLSRDVVFGEGEPEAHSTRPLEVRRKAQVTIDLNGYSINRGLSSSDVPTEEDSERCIYVVSGSVVIRDSRGGGRICGGCCQRGGGIFVAEGSLVLEGGAITSNVATYGGGVYVGMGTFEMRGGRITGNVALAKGLPAGGGVYVGDNNALMLPSGENLRGQIERADMVMSGGSVSDNTAAGWGAGLCVSNGTLTIVDGVVEGNGRRGFASVGGGGIYACGGSDVSIEGGSVLNNELFGKEGAGIGVDEFSTLEILDVTVSGNRGRMSGAGIAVTDSEATIDGAVIENNFTYGSGAGLLVGEGATVHMLSGSINNNRCRVDGGGVEVAFGGSFRMSDGEISDNLAWVGSNLESSSADDEMGPLADGGLTSEHFNMGGGIDARGDLCVSGGTIASNGAIIGCGICFNCERWDTERHDLTLSGAPLFKDNYLSWAKYSETDVSIYMGDNEDESALVRVDGSLQPLRPIRIEKLYRSGWETIALVDEGDYEVGAFRSMQGVTWDTTSPYTLTKRDGLLYAALPQNTADLPSADSSGFGQRDSGIHPPCGPFQSPSASPYPGVRQRGVSRRQIAWAPVPLRVGLRRGPAVRYLVPSMGRAFFGGGWRRAFAPWYGVGSADPMGWARSAWMYPAYCQPWMRYGYGRSANVFASAMLRCPGYAGFDWRNPYVGAWGSWW